MPCDDDHRGTGFGMRPRDGPQRSLYPGRHARLVDRALEECGLHSRPGDAVGDVLDEQLGHFDAGLEVAKCLRNALQVDSRLTGRGKQRLA